MRDVTVAVGQWAVVDDRARNLELAERFLREAAARGAQIALLPEMFQTPYDMDLLRDRAEDLSGPSLVLVRALAAELGVLIVAGSIPEKDGDRIYNTSFVFGPDGAELGRHRKIHLFDVDLPTVKVSESSVLSPGDEPLVLGTPHGTLGVAICYDTRFHDVFRVFKARGVELVLLPAAFSHVTGSAHWHVLMRSRAIDYQVFVAAACPAPTSSAKYQTFGHSLIVDPWGDILAEAGTTDACLTATLSAERLETIRRQLPLQSHRGARCRL